MPGSPTRCCQKRPVTRRRCRLLPKRVQLLNARCVLAAPGRAALKSACPPPVGFRSQAMRRRLSPPAQRPRLPSRPGLCAALTQPSVAWSGRVGTSGLRARAAACASARDPARAHAATGPKSAGASGGDPAGPRRRPEPGGGRAQGKVPSHQEAATKRTTLATAQGAGSVPSASARTSKASQLPLAKEKAASAKRASGPAQSEERRRAGPRAARPEIIKSKSRPARRACQASVGKPASSAPASARSAAPKAYATDRAAGPGARAASGTQAEMSKSVTPKPGASATLQASASAAKRNQTVRAAAGFSTSRTADSWRRIRLASPPARRSDAEPAKGATKSGQQRKRSRPSGARARAALGFSPRAPGAGVLPGAGIAVATAWALPGPPPVPLKAALPVGCSGSCAKLGLRGG